MTTLSDLMKTRRIIVPTAGGPVELQSPAASVVPDLLKAPEHRQHALAVAACAVEPRMTEEEAQALPADILYPLAERCHKLIHPGAEGD